VRPERPELLCVVPADLAESLHDILRRFFRDDPTVTVVVERRGVERRQESRRSTESVATSTSEKRRIRSDDGRRIASRRADELAALPRSLPRRARPHAERILFVERLEPSGVEAQDADTDRLVALVQSGDQSVFADLYNRHYDRVFSYLRIALSDYHAAEDTTQQVFVRALEKISQYEIRPGLPFRAWLLGIARYESLNHLRKRSWIGVISPEEIDRRIGAEVSEFDRGLLGLLSDSDLSRFVERMSDPQLQVVVLRYVLGLRFVEIAKVTGRSAASVRQLHHRALVYLEQRMTAMTATTARERVSRAPVRVVIRQSIALRTRRFLLTRSLGSPVLSQRPAAFRSTSRR